MAETDDGEETIRYFKCVECGTDNLDASNCHACGHPSPSDSADIIRVTLTFVAATCPGCQQLSAPPTCLRCGASVPEPDAPDKAVRARQMAFGPLLEELLQVKKGFEVPPANVRVAADQYMASFMDADLFEASLKLLAFARDLAAMEFTDTSAIGGRTRRKVQQYVELLADLQCKTARLAWFAPPDEVAELRELLIGVGSHGAWVAEEMLRLLMAANLGEAQDAAGRWQTALSGFTAPERFTDLFSSLLQSYVPDLNARLEVGLDIEGQFIGPYGLIDLPRVLGAAARTSEHPLDAIAERAGGFFSHLMNTPAEQLRESGIGLMFAAVPLAMADRPLDGHTIARLTQELGRDAHACAPQETCAIIAGIVEDSGAVFEASMRIHRELRLLATGQVEGVKDIIIGLVKNYKTLAESAYRTYSQATVDLRAVRDRRPSFRDHPVLGTLLDRLSAAHDELGDLLIAAVDTRLRNAEAHEDYRVASDGTITFIADAATLDIDTLSERTETLATAVAGMQAGLICFAVDHQLLDSAPAWLPRGELVARSILAALGGDVGFLTIGPTVEIGFSDIPDSPLELLTLLVALVPILNEASEFRVYDSAGGIALICPAAPLQAFATADDDIRDLATIAANYAAAVATGADPNNTFVDAFSAMLMMVTAGIEADIEQLEPRTVFRRAELRLAYVRQLAAEHRPTEERSTAAALAAVAAAERATKPAARGNTLALRQLASQLGHLEEWVATHRVQWPPEWLATAQPGPSEAS